MASAELSWLHDGAVRTAPLESRRYYEKNRERVIELVSARSRARRREEIERFGWRGRRVSGQGSADGGEL